MKLVRSKSTKTLKPFAYIPGLNPSSGTRLCDIKRTSELDYPIRLTSFMELEHGNRHHEQEHFEIFLSNEECKRLKESIELMLNDTSYLKRNGVTE